MLILGLLLLIGAGIVGTAGVLNNRGAGHPIPGGVHAFGYTLHTTSGQLFLWGIIVGAAGVLGLALIAAGLGVGAKRRRAARRDSAWRRRTERAAARPATVTEPAADVDTDADTNADTTVTPVVVPRSRSSRFSTSRARKVDVVEPDSSVDTEVIEPDSASVGADD
jgi:hypothetical protein